MKRKMRMILRVTTDEQCDGNAFSVTIYDCTIEDLQERRKQALTFQSIRSAATHLGVSHSSVKKYYTNNAIKLQKRLFSAKLQKEFAVRITKNAI